MVLHLSHLARRTPGLRSHTPALSYTPAQIFKAMKIPVVGKIPLQKIGIVSLGGGHSENDLHTAIAHARAAGFALRVLRVNGGRQGVYGRSPADVENQLDLLNAGLLYNFATGEVGDLTIAYGDNASPTAIPDCILALIEAGAVSIGLSWGIARNLLGSALKAARARVFRLAHERNVTVCVASGDASLFDGEGVAETDDPAGDPYAVAVGGTSLFLKPDGSIQEERAWGDGNPNDAGSGGGWNPDSPAPPWQTAAFKDRPDFKGLRGVPDWSWPADPAAGGVEIVANGQWQTVGGTSAGAPACAGFFAVAKGVLAREAALRKMLAPSFGHPGNILYPAAKTACRDIVLGSNGMPATAGYDLVTGLGSLDGEGALLAILDALLIPAAPVGDPGKSPDPNPVAPPPPAVFDPTPAVEGVFATWRTTLRDAVSRRTLGEIEADVLAALRPPHMAGAEAHADARITGATALLIAVNVLQGLVRVFGPMALAKAEEYLSANTRLTDAQKAFLRQLLEGMLADRPAAPAPTPALPHAAREGFAEGSYPFLVVSAW